MEMALKNKINLIRGMHEIICSLNDEEAYMTWIMVVPDGATYDDFSYIAETDNLFKETCQLFVNLVKFYLPEGLFVDGVTYYPRGDE